jgi:hypothetical protein
VVAAPLHVACRAGEGAGAAGPLLTPESTSPPPKAAAMAAEAIDSTLAASLFIFSMSIFLMSFSRLLIAQFSVKLFPKSSENQNA